MAKQRPTSPEELDAFFDNAWKKALGERVKGAAVSIFDAPGFTVVCPQCKLPTKLEDALDRDHCGSGCPGEYQVTVVCPHCKLEATL